LTGHGNHPRPKKPSPARTWRRGLANKNVANAFINPVPPQVASFRAISVGDRATCILPVLPPTSRPRPSLERHGSHEKAVFDIGARNWLGPRGRALPDRHQP